MFYKSFDDEVFAKFLNYMQKALDGLFNSI